MKKIFFLFLVMINFSCPKTFNDIRVMSFNIRYDTESDGVHKWDNRKDFVLKVIQDFDPDLLGIQEAMKSQVDYLSNNLKNYYSIGVKNRQDIDQQDSLLFVKRERYTITKDIHFWMSNNPLTPYSNDFDRSPGHPGYGPRTMSCVELVDNHNGDEVFFCNTHWDGNILWNEQAALLARYIFMKYGKKINILVGDFNDFPFSYESWPTEPSWIVGRKSRAYDTLTSFMVDGFKEINPDNKQPSGCGWEPECPEEFMGDYRIDWVLHSKNLVVKRSEILVERRNGAPSSDHFPVISILNYPLLDKAP